MADLTAEIETMEHRFMRAWAKRDLQVLKSMTGSGFQFLVGSRPAVMLDRRSWIDSAATRLLCSGYRFGDIYVRELGGSAIFASQVELQASLDGKDWSGQFWVTDLWRRGRIRRRWRLGQRILSRVDEGGDAVKAIRSMQLWR